MMKLLLVGHGEEPPKRHTDILLYLYLYDASMKDMQLQDVNLKMQKPYTCTSINTRFHTKCSHLSICHHHHFKVSNSIVSPFPFHHHFWFFVINVFFLIMVYLNFLQKQWIACRKKPSTIVGKVILIVLSLHTFILS